MGDVLPFFISLGTVFFGVLCIVLCIMALNGCWGACRPPGRYDRTVEFRGGLTVEFSLIVVFSFFRLCEVAMCFPIICLKCLRISAAGT